MGPGNWEGPLCASSPPSRGNQQRQLGWGMVDSGCGETRENRTGGGLGMSLAQLGASGGYQITRGYKEKKKKNKEQFPILVV